MNAREVGRLYDDVARQYDATYERPVDRAQDRLFAETLRRHYRGGRILDLGCGTGLVRRLLEPPADRYVGVDASSAMLDTARSLDGMHSYVCGDMHTVPLELGRFQLVTFAYSFSYGHGPTLLRAACEALEPGGRLIVYGAYGPVFRHSRGWQGRTADIQRWSRRRLVSAASEAGLRVLESWSSGVLDRAFGPRIPRLHLPGALSRHVAIVAEKNRTFSARTP